MHCPSRRSDYRSCACSFRLACTGDCPSGVRRAETHRALAKAQAAAVDSGACVVPAPFCTVVEGKADLPAVRYLRSSLAFALAFAFLPFFCFPPFPFPSRTPAPDSITHAAPVLRLLSLAWKPTCALSGSQWFPRPDTFEDLTCSAQGVVKKRPLTVVSFIAVSKAILMVIPWFIRRPSPSVAGTHRTGTAES